MKIFRLAQLALGVFLALLSFASVPAQAQLGWQVDSFECAGTDKWTDNTGVAHTVTWPATSSGPGTTSYGTTPNVYLGSTPSGNNSYDNPIQSVGTVRVVFGWHGPGQAPDNLSAQISSDAYTASFNFGPDPDDGFQDPPTRSASSYQRLGAQDSEGSHVIQLSNPNHNITVKTIPYSLSAITGTGGYCTTLHFFVQITSPVLYGYSTHCAPALGASDPNFNPTSPAYFSGTGCQATGNAVALSGTVSHAQLCIGENGGDTVVKEYWDSSQAGAPSQPPPGNSIAVGSQLASVNLSALFDSTHFKDQTKIKVTLKVWDTNGGHYDVKVIAPAYNKAYIMENNTTLTMTGDPLLMWGGIIGRVKKDLEPLNYNTDLSSYLDRENPTSKDLSNKLPKSTVFYADTHTSDLGFGDCFNEGPLGGSGNPLTTGGLEYSNLPPIIAKKNIYSGPYPSASTPPYNLVFIDGCHSAGQFGSNGDNSTAGGAGSFGIYAPGKDRAFLGWTNFVSLWPLPLNDGTGFTAKLFDHLAEDHDLYTACTLSIADSPRIGWLGDDPTGKDKFNTGPLSPHIIGDPKMKMHGVYGDVILGYLIDAHGKETTAYDRYAWFKPL